MSDELLSNNAQSVVVSGLANVTNPVTFIVASAAAFPSTGNFRVLVEAEILLVTAVAGTSFTADRAQEGSSAASHANGVLVTHVLTAGGLDQFIRDVIGNGIDHVLITGTGLDSALTITDTANPAGANITLTGNGATTPTKFIRSANDGDFEVLSSAYATLLRVSEAGVLSVMNTTLKVVSFGANDSGAAGFRLMRVPNS